MLKHKLTNSNGFKTRGNFTHSLTFAIASVSSLSLILLGLFLIPNFSPSPTHAEGAASDPTISIVPASNLTVDINPGASGTFNSGSANVTVNTTNATGYTFTMSTETTDTDLKNNRIDYTQSGNTNLKITNLSSSTAQSNFTNNKWGYNVTKSNTYLKGAANTYVPVPNSNSQQSDKEIEVTSTTGSNTYTFSYGVKADLSLPSGDYTNTIVYSATANPLPTMQEFDYTACTALTTDQTITLYDSRDNTPYTVAKLQDGNCWMTQNLELGEYGTSTTLTSADSNVSSSGYTLSFSHANDTIYKGDSNKYGNYYNWSQATAGSGTTTAKEDAPYDICPKGWRLPSAGNTDYTASEFYIMLNHYITTGTWNTGTYNYWSGTTLSEWTSSPVSLVFSGYVDSADNYSLKQQNSRGYWSMSTSGGSAENYRLYIYDYGEVGPYSKHLQTNGRSVRCLVNRPTLYDEVAKMSKGTQTNGADSSTGIRAAITTPTSTDYTQDTSNSGVYEYDASVFGASSDASNSYKIYYYRGVLDSSGNTGAYGWGLADVYPNYVVLSSANGTSGISTNDTCWRIVRTTGSGGIKMIYAGQWTGLTCANSATNAMSNVYFNRGSTNAGSDFYGTRGRVYFVGYNYTPNSSSNTVSNSTVFQNGTASNLRVQLENWYNDNLTSYTSKLETSAGWCNDRTTYGMNPSPGSPTSSTVPNTGSGTGSSSFTHFGAYTRLEMTDYYKPSLTCPNSTGYDRLSVGNGLGVPSAPLTADEAIFAGTGNGWSISPSHRNSYLSTDQLFWLLTPLRREQGGRVNGLISGNQVSERYIYSEYGMRPTISLKPRVAVPVSGSGTATDPWIVNP